MTGRQFFLTALEGGLPCRIQMKKAIVTFYQNKYRFLDIVLPRFRNYASRVGAEMIEVDMDGSSNVFMDKFAHVGLLPHQRCIVLDVDILLRNDTPDLFKIVPEDSLGIYDEGSSFHRFGHPDIEQIEYRHNAYAHLVDYCGFDSSPISGSFSYERPLKYYNMGVVVYNRQSIELHRSLSKDIIIRLREYKGWSCVEQTLLSYMILNSSIKTFNLPTCFNQMPCNRSVDYLKTSYISHYAGLGEAKYDEIVRDDAVWKSEGF
jgi:lipopolysaccharide biosynthesis glycosyltransferase